MTPEAIAKQCAEAIRPVRPRQHKNIKNMVLAQQKEVAAKLLPILTTHFATTANLAAPAGAAEAFEQLHREIDSVPAIDAVGLAREMRERSDRDCQAATAGVEEAAKRIAEKSVPFLITDKGKQDGYPLAGIDIGRYAEAIAAELTALLAPYVARLAVLGKVEEMPAKGVELLIRPAKDFGGGVVVEVRDAKFHTELYSRYGDTIEKALAALVEQGGDGGQ